MKKLALYLETSIIGFLFAEEIEEKKSVTRKLFQEIKDKKFDAYISDLVLKELDFTKDEKKRKEMKKIVEDFHVLKTTEQCNNLGLQYIKNKAIAQGAVSDAIHVAVATFYNLDIIVSWNLRHIVKVRTKMEVNSINMRNNYKSIEIATPEEVVEND